MLLKTAKLWVLRSEFRVLLTNWKSGRKTKIQFIAIIIGACAKHRGRYTKCMRQEQDTGNKSLNSIAKRNGISWCENINK